MYDWANSVMYNNVLVAFLPPFLTLLAKENIGDDGRIGLFGFRVLPDSYFTYWVMHVGVSILVRNL